MRIGQSFLSQLVGGYGLMGDIFKDHSLSPVKDGNECYARAVVIV